MLLTRLIGSCCVHADALFQAEQLQQLTCLTKLQQLSLMYTSAAKARSAAPAWRQLSCLHSLEIRDCRAELSMEEGQQLLAAVGAATSLVELDLSADGSLLDEETDICSYFTGGLLQCSWLHSCTEYKDKAHKFNDVTSMLCLHSASCSEGSSCQQMDHCWMRRLTFAATSQVGVEAIVNKQVAVSDPGILPFASVSVGRRADDAGAVVCAVQ